MLKIGFAGAGYICGIHKNNLVRDERVEIVSTFDCDPSRSDAASFDETDSLYVCGTINGVYGTLTLGDDGAYTYTLNNADPDTNARRRYYNATH